MDAQFGTETYQVTKDADDGVVRFSQENLIDHNSEYGLISGEYIKIFSISPKSQQSDH